jgi:2-polyprenyl-3-methyl-5-hydroxy-6-metoxy-1,4-benzoquinol methylase
MAASEYDWDQHWDEYADAAARNPAQRMRRQVIRRLLRVGDGPARILDIGCGQGDLAVELRLAYPQAELCGVDYSQGGVDSASKKVPSARFLARDLVAEKEAPEELKGWATHAVCSEVLEHLDDPLALMRNSANYLAPGCRLVVTVPGGPMSAFDRHIGHRQHFTPASLRTLLTEAGYEVEKATGVGFPLFNLYRLVVIQRGENLVREVASTNSSWTLSAARAVMKAFTVLFALGTPEARWGWQVVAVARLPRAGSTTTTSTRT